MNHPPQQRPLHIAVVGPALDARGGIASVASAWLGSPVIEDLEIEYFETMRDGPGPRKAAHMARQQVRFLARLARGWRPDLFHVHLSYFTSFYRKLAYIEEALATGAPVIVHVHAPDLEGFARSRRLHAAALRKVFHQVDRVVVLSHAMARTVHELTGPQTAIEVIYNPVKIEDFACPPRPDTREPICLFMGEIGDRKGTFDLVEAIPSILDKVPGARFRFGGNGEVERLRKRIAELGIGSRAEILGWVSGEEKLRQFREASVYCLPSYHEGLPMSILEAMAAGLPVVSTPIAGIPEAVLDGQTGYLVQPGDVPALADRLTRLLGDRAERHAQGEAGLKRARELFEVDVVVRQVRELWDRVLAGHPRRRS